MNGETVALSLMTNDRQASLPDRRTARVSLGGRRLAVVDTSLIAVSGASSVVVVRPARARASHQRAVDVQAGRVARSVLLELAVGRHTPPRRRRGDYVRRRGRDRDADGEFRHEDPVVFRADGRRRPDHGRAARQPRACPGADKTELRLSGRVNRVETTLRTARGRWRVVAAGGTCVGPLAAHRQGWTRSSST